MKGNIGRSALFSQLICAVTVFPVHLFSGFQFLKCYAFVSHNWTASSGYGMIEWGRIFMHLAHLRLNDVERVGSVDGELIHILHHERQ